MKGFWRALLGVVVVVLVSASSCNGEPDPEGYEFRLGEDLVDVALANGFNPRRLVIQRQLEDGSWVRWLSFEGRAALAADLVVDGCSTFGDMRLVDAPGRVVLFEFPSPVCFESIDEPFVITLDMVEWPALSQ